MKTNQNRSLGSAKLSRQSPISRNKSSLPSTSKRTESIQNYFNKSSESHSHASETFDSPYKDSVGEIKCQALSADLNDDFKTPQPTRSKPKALQKPKDKQKTTRSRPRKSSKGNYVIKFTKDNFGQSDVNPNQLQMALALSRSTFALENPGRSDEVEDTPNFLSIENIAKVKTTLERYGFRSNRPKLHTDTKRDRPQARKSRPSKFQYITPILKTRTEEQRQALISSKISLILNENTYQSNSSESTLPNNEYEPFSNFLKQFDYKENIIFSFNNLDHNEIKSFSYYNKNLNLSPRKNSCGCLLKNWDEIPGRDKSPVRHNYHEPRRKIDAKESSTCSQIDQNDTNSDCLDKNIQKSCAEDSLGSNSLDKSENSVRNCLSPDLFVSDDEETEDIVPSPSKTSHSTSIKSKKCADGSESEEMEILECNTFSSTSGILHFETFSSDADELSRDAFVLTQKMQDDRCKEQRYSEIIDLSQSSDSENAVTNSNDKSLTPTDDKSVGNVLDTGQSQQNNYFSSKNTDFKAAIECRKLDNKMETKEFFEYDLTQDSSSEDDDNNSNTAKHSQGISLFDEIDNDNLKDVQIQSKLSNDTGSDDIEDNGKSGSKDNTFDKCVKVGDFDPMCSLNSSELLNVTDYIHNILNNDVSANQDNVKESQERSFDENDLSQKSCSQESIVISDEELNYSSVQSNYKDLKNSQDFYRLSENEDAKEHMDDSIDVDGIHSDNVTESQERSFDENDLGQQSCSQESIVISDEELNYSSVQSNYKDLKSSQDFYRLSENEDEAKEHMDDSIDVGGIHSALRNKYNNESPLTHNRVTELKQRLSITRDSIARAFLQESFTEFDTQNSKLGEQKEAQSIENETEVITPEKVLTNIKDETPDNNFIIKTKNITPMVNYDELDTPNIAKKLETFGLKPLKRQRGAKLLKYLYECTHPVVERTEVQELSSDEDDRRIVKKSKHSKITSPENNIASTLNENNAVVEDFLEKEDKDLIFERKYSSKTPSCRVPLQIVWHNFICGNPRIEEDILIYKPLQLETLHCTLKEQSGCKFHIQDLTAFLDKKCITIRTSQEGGRKNK